MLAETPGTGTIEFSPKSTSTNAWFQKALKVAEDPSSSDWLKQSLIGAIDRDPVNAAGDAEVLCEILQMRAAAVLEGDFRPSSKDLIAQELLAPELSPA